MFKLNFSARATILHQFPLPLPSTTTDIHESLHLAPHRNMLFNIPMLHAIRFCAVPLVGEFHGTATHGCRELRQQKRH